MQCIISRRKLQAANLQQKEKLGTADKVDGQIVELKKQVRSIPLLHF